VCTIQLENVLDEGIQIRKMLQLTGQFYMIILNLGNNYNCFDMIGRSNFEFVSLVIVQYSYKDKLHLILG